MSLARLVDFLFEPQLDRWTETHKELFQSLFGQPEGLFPATAARTFKLRAPTIAEGATYAAYIHPQNPDSGAYGGMSLVFFPPDSTSEKGGPCLVTFTLGTQGLSPDEDILSRPGHARKVQAICDWLNRRQPGSAWAKSEPTRRDVPVPQSVRSRLTAYGSALEKYRAEIYALFGPTRDRRLLEEALVAFLDVFASERGATPLKRFEANLAGVRSQWSRFLFPLHDRAEVAQLLRERRFLILQGPPGVGKTHLATEILQKDFHGCGKLIQFHSNTTYENFVGGLAPVMAKNETGLRFEPRRGALLEAVEAADGKAYLLAIDEINRADLAKVLGEALFLLESKAPDREVELAYDFGEPVGRKLRLPENLHILGTMNTADRSIAIVDFALRRRFAFLALWPDREVVRALGTEQSLKFFDKAVAVFVEYATRESFALVPGHSYFIARDEDEARRRLKYELVPLLEEYLAQGYVANFAEEIRTLIQEIRAL